MEILKSGLALGAEVKYLDLKKDLTNIDIKNINEAWDKNLVLFFKNQNLSDPDLIKFSKNFGNLDLPNTNPYGINFSPEYPEINVISNVKKKRYTHWYSRRWRSDMACRYDISRYTSKSCNFILIRSP